MSTVIKSEVWIDYSNIPSIQFIINPIEINIIESKFRYLGKVQHPDKINNLLSKQDQQQQSSWYKKLSAAIRNYEAQILRDPTEAKAAMFNMLKADLRFANIIPEFSNKMIALHEN